MIGRGVELALPALPLVAPLTVQLRSETGVCWDADYGTLRRNTSSLLRGVTD